jgi:hypothetical protein
MATSTATTVDQYLAQLPVDRRDAIAKVADVMRTNLPPGFEEGMLYGTIGWYVPKAKLDKTYNGQPFAIACLGNQKNYMALYLMSVYGSSALNKWFVGAYKKTGKKLDMGKACIRFKTLDALPLDVVGEAARRVTVDDWVAVHEATHGKAAKAKRAKAKPAKAKPAKAKARPKKRR